MTTFSPDFSHVASDSIEEYGRFQQHLVLLEDAERIEKYHNAINSVELGNTVVDIGAGTGILSLIALKAGFDYAVLIEPSRKISSYAEYVLNKNGFKGKFKILQKPLENVRKEELPGSVDLLLSETISSLIIGFGSWQQYDKLLERVKSYDNVIPNHGSLYASLSETDLATRNPFNTGLKYCSGIGIDIDIYYRTFRSGGNIFDKNTVNGLIESVNSFPVLKFDFRNYPVFSEMPYKYKADRATYFTGLTCFWEIALDHAGKNILNSRNPGLSSWYPFYIPFAEPLNVSKDQELNLTIKTKTLDYPYPDTFQVFNNSSPVSNILYW
jgi:hypothetical protein